MERRVWDACITSQPAVLERLLRRPEGLALIHSRWEMERSTGHHGVRSMEYWNSLPSKCRMHQVCKETRVATARTCRICATPFYIKILYSSILVFKQETLMHLAARKGHTDIMEVLHRFGASIEALQEVRMRSP